VATKKQRQRRLAAEAHQRKLTRQQEQERRAKQWAAGIIVAVLVVGVGIAAAAGSGVFSKAKPKPAAAPKPPAVVHCTYTAAGTAARKVSLPPASTDPQDTYQATIATNRGAIVVDLLNSKAPCTVNSFVSLASQGFFNKTPCPRLSTGGLSMLQCGDPTGTMSGGPGYEFASENLAGATYSAGTLAMANSGAPDSNGSQFFLVFQTSALSPDYTPFGRVVSGLNILQNVGKVGFGPPLSQAGGGAPKEKVEIESVTIKKT
jgi:cyclophilin family peptidyl-prolyl cis-trans isomerase